MNQVGLHVGELPALPTGAVVPAIVADRGEQAAWRASGSMGRLGREVARKRHCHWTVACPPRMFRRAPHTS